jgi:LysM repeat protein
MADDDINKTVDALLKGSKTDTPKATSQETPKVIQQESQGNDPGPVERPKPSRPSSSLGVYTVRKGDTHEDIKRWYGVNFKDQPKVLKVGQKIKIPLQVGKEVS